MRKLLPILLLGLSGCFGLPQPPGAGTYARLGVDGAVGAAGLPLYRMAGKRRPARNAIFVVLEASFQKYFRDELPRLYRTKKEVRLEDVAWWALAPGLKGIYDKVIRLPEDRFNAENLQASLDFMEKAGKPYDLYLLTHGIPNHITTTRGSPLLSWKQIDDWKRRFPGLGLVFLQSCYGTSLAPDWLATGARAVMSYADENRNFFFPMVLLKSLRQFRALETTDPARWLAEAHEEAARILPDEVWKSRLDRFVVEKMGLGLDEFLRDSPPPTLRSH